MNSLRYSAFAALSLSAFLAAPACTYEGDVHNYYGFGGQGGEGPGTGGTGASGAYESHLPECAEEVPLEELDIDLFSADGHLFYFEVTPAMRELQDTRACDGAPLPGPVFDKVGAVNDGVYSLGEEAECPPSAFNVRVVAAGSNNCSDTGEVELALKGQSSFREWKSIPNFKLKVDEFIDQKFASGDKTLRLNNGQADSTILREATALRIWRALGHPAPPTSFVKTMSNVWDTEFKVGTFAAHVLVKPYKKAFFKEFLPDVTDAWEGQGDPFGEWEASLECEWSAEEDCDGDLIDEAKAIIQSAPLGAGFMAATDSVVDWGRTFDNQCLSAITATGDDWIHAQNNVVLARESNGKFSFLPYSTDISGGHPWSPSVTFDGMAVLTTRCAEDPECRAASLDRCELLIDRFEALDVPNSIVKERCGALKKHGLLRGPDEDVCDDLMKFYTARPEELRNELESLRSLGAGGAGGATSP